MEKLSIKYRILLMATLKEIANKAGVSSAAASRVLNHDPTFVASKSVRLAIMKAAVEMGYKTPRQKKEEHNVIEVGIADWHSVPESRKNEISYDSLVPLTETKVDYSFARLEKGKPRKVDAIIGIGIFSKEEIDELMFSSTNIIFLNNHEEDIPFDRLFIDYDTSVHKSIRYLKEKGLSKIAFISGISEENSITIGKRRIEGVSKVMKKEGVYDENLVFVGDLTDASGFDLMNKALQNDVDAVILGTQLIEKGVLEAYNKAERKPELILRRDVDLGYKKADEAVVRMSSEQLWQITLLLILLRTKGEAPPLTVYVEAVFEEKKN